MKMPPNDVIPLRTIEAAAATLPDASTSEYWAKGVDVVSQNGVACTINFEIRPFNCPDNTQWRWEVVTCIRR